MSDSSTAAEAAQSDAPVAVLLAEFDSPKAVTTAAASVRDAGYSRWDVHSPFPIHGIERAMGVRYSRLPWLVLGGGLTGAAVALLLQWWTNATSYATPLPNGLRGYQYLISGKPYFSLPANIPVTFELIVLLSAFAAFFGMFALNRLPRFSHPVFQSERFRRVTSDGFFISVEAADPKFELDATGALLRSLGATHVETCPDPTRNAKLPVGVHWAGATATVVALTLLALVAMYRAEPKSKPRVHLVQDMDFQPKFKAQAACPLFPDGRSTRLPVPGTVARGQLQLDDHLYRGKVGEEWATDFPMPVDVAMAQRGQQRYDIYCAPCHGLTGEGGMTGMVSVRAVKRGEPGWVLPLSLLGDGVRGQPVGQLYNTVTNGARTMPGYGSQIPVDDRWAIVLYIRALQLSQHADEADVPPEDRELLR